MCRPFGTRIVGDLDHDEYDSINPVFLNASARDLQGYVDALPFPSLLDYSMDRSLRVRIFFVLHATFPNSGIRARSMRR